MTIHCRLPLEKPRSAWADGKAMFTTVASSTTMSCASATVVSVSQRPEVAVGTTWFSDMWQTYPAPLSFETNPFRIWGAVA